MFWRGTPIGSWRSWGVLCAAFLVMAGTGVIINVLSRRVDEDRRVQRSLVQLQGDAREMEALEWRTIFKGKLDGDLSRRPEKITSAMDAGIEKLRSLEPGLPQLRDVAAKYETCSKLIDEEFHLLADGKIKEAVELDAAKVDPAFDDLYQTLSEAENAFDKHASRTLALVRAGTFLVLLAALGFVATLFWHYHQRRRAGEVAAAEQRVLNLLRAITEGTSDAIFAKDREGRYLMMNTAGAHLAGKTPEEMIGLDDTHFFSEETGTRIIERDRTIIRTGEARTDEDITTTLAGRSRVYLTTKGALRDSTGAIIGLFGVSRDITERKQAEEALAEQAVRNKTLMETSADSIYVLNERGDLQEANAAFLRRRGYTAAEAKGLNVSDWDAQWTREQLQELFQEKLRKADDDTVFETRHRCKDGSVFDVEVSATRVRIGGQQLFFCVTRDITERKRADQALRETEIRFRQLAENISQAFWLSNAEGTLIHYISPAYEKISGRSCESLYANPESWLDFVHSEDRERIAADERSQSITGQHDRSYRIVRPDGSVRWIHDRAFPVRDESGELIRVAGIVEDITERKEAEEKLERYAHLLQTLSHRLFQIQEEERRHLARELHDEIGQTLTAAKINTDMLRAAVPPGLAARLDENAAILDRLVRLTRQISLDLRPPLLDDLGLVPALRWYVNQQAERAGLEATFSADALADDVHPHIQIACFRLAQEAITNVVRHAHASTLGVELRRTDSSLHLLVWDDGQGFDVAAAEARAEQGASLGLLGLKERAALAGGRARVISSPGEGATVKILLPLDGAESAVATQTQAETKSRKRQRLS